MKRKKNFRKKPSSRYSKLSLFQKPDTTNWLALEIEWNSKDSIFDRDLSLFGRLHEAKVIDVGIIVTRGNSMQQNLNDLFARFCEQNNLWDIESKIKEVYQITENSNGEQIEYEYNPSTKQKNEINSRIANGWEFNHAWSSVFVQNKYGNSTTHFEKLENKLHQGIGGTCPIIAIGLPKTIININT